MGKRNRLILLNSILISSLFFSCNQKGPAKYLTDKNSELTKLAGGFLFTEGPVKDSDGNLYFSDIQNNRIHIWSKDNELSIFRENSGGANGLSFDHNKNLIVCEGTVELLQSIRMVK